MLRTFTRVSPRVRVMAASAALSTSPLQTVATDGAPAAIGPYSQAVVCNGTVYVSGMLGLVPGDGKGFAGDSVGEQTRQALENMKSVLEAAGSSLSCVAKTTVLMTDMANYGAINEVYSEFFGGDSKPARAAFAVKGLPADALVEIDAVACLSSSDRS